MGPGQPGQPLGMRGCHWLSWPEALGGLSASAFWGTLRFAPGTRAITSPSINTDGQAAFKQTRILKRPIRRR